MFFVAIQPEMPTAAVGNLPAIANDLSALTAAQFAAHAVRRQAVRAGSYAATDAASSVAIS
jgi:hypothetical protein